MPQYTKYYEHDAFFSHCSKDQGFHPMIFHEFRGALESALNTPRAIANNRIARLPNTAPKIYAAGKTVGNIRANGALLDTLRRDAGASLVFAAFIGNNYLINEPCLTELLGFLESPRDPRVFMDTLFVAFFPDVTAEQLFDPEPNIEVDGISDGERKELLRLSQAIAKRLTEIYRSARNMTYLSIREYDAATALDPAQFSRSEATRLAIQIVSALKKSAHAVDPVRVDDDCVNGKADPLVVARASGREGAESHDKVVALLEKQSETDKDWRPLRGYPVSLEKLLQFADGPGVSPFDPRLPALPQGVVLSREAAGAFAIPQEAFLGKLKRFFATLHISAAPPPPADGVSPAADEQGNPSLEPAENAANFVRAVQKRCLGI